MYVLPNYIDEPIIRCWRQARCHADADTDADVDVDSDADVDADAEHREYTEVSKVCSAQNTYISCMHSTE